MIAITHTKSYIFFSTLWTASNFSLSLSFSIVLFSSFRFRHGTKHASNATNAAWHWIWRRTKGSINYHTVKRKYLSNIYIDLNCFHPISGRCLFYRCFILISSWLLICCRGELRKFWCRLPWLRKYAICWFIFCSFWS